MERKSMIASLLTLCLISGSAYAIWANYTSSIQGTITVSGGTAPPVVEYLGFDQVITEAITNVDFNTPGVYIAAGGGTDYTVTCDLSLLVSTDPACIYQENVDLSVIVQVHDIFDKIDCTNGGAQFTDFVEDSDNELYFTFLRDDAACPLSGDFSVTVAPTV